MGVDVVYLAWNRLEFTKLSFHMLIENTNWALVDDLIVYDDGSDDGTRAWLEDATLAAAARARHGSGPRSMSLRHTLLRSPVKIMNDYAHDAPSETFAKIDNDVVVPPGWLDALLEVWNACPELGVLGMEAGRCGPPVAGLPYAFRPADHVGGVGLIRTAPLRREPIHAAGRYGGFTGYQRSMGARGWISPDVLVSSVSCVPDEPWRSLSERYIAAGWQRRWWQEPGLSGPDGYYLDDHRPHWAWWPDVLTIPAYPPTA